MWGKKRISKDLHIVKLSGGLGNQMFQYALYRRLQSQGKTVKMDDFTEYAADNTRPKQLQTAFGITYERCTREELTDLTDAYMNPGARVRRKILGRQTKSYMEKQFHFDEAVLEQESAYYEGCWQTEKYFKEIEAELRKSFQFQCEIPKATRQFLSQIEATNAVSIHIRRGDYLNSEVQEVYGNICTDAYYRKAISRMAELVEKPTYYIFTNDMDWAKEQMQEENFVLVDCNDESTGYLDMLLMSKCQHHIIANSSFSWWGAWLNANPEKIIMAPSKWLNGRDCSDIYRSGMLVI